VNSHLDFFGSVGTRAPRKVDVPKRDMAESAARAAPESGCSVNSDHGGKNRVPLARVYPYLCFDQLLAIITLCWDRAALPMAMSHRLSSPLARRLVQQSNRYDKDDGSVVEGRSCKVMRRRVIEGGCSFYVAH
jgi:hypothetical protein